MRQGSIKEGYHIQESDQKNLDIYDKLSGFNKGFETYLSS